MAGAGSPLQQMHTLSQAPPAYSRDLNEMPPPASASVSPRFPSTSLINSRAGLTTDVQRKLPSIDVTDDDIDEAFIAFILYCNPHYSLDTDTSELKRIFRNPPRSDGKEFSIFRLWELLQKFESKEIKTWAQLALDLGVEPPSLEKGGSVQKVQQYSVRLKVGLHSHAYFEFDG
jgi:hypothetical protein